MEQLETQLGEIKTALVETSSKMLEAVAQRDEEIKALGNAREETGARIASLDTQVMQIAADVKGVQEAVRTFQAEEQRLLSPFDADVKSIGDIFTTSQAYEEMVASKATYSQPVNLKGFFTKVSHADAQTSIDAAGNLLGRSLQRNNIMVEGQRPVRLRDLMTVVPTNATNVEFVQQLGFASIRTFILDSPIPTDTVVTVDNVNGFVPGMQVTINGDTRRIVSAVRDTSAETGVITLDAALSATPAAGDVVTSLAIGGIAETRYKPSIRMRLEEKLAVFKARGFSVWLDDYGEGSRNEKTLRHPAVDVVKLDHCFVNEPVEELTPLVGLIHAEGKLVLIEGLETEAQREVMLAAGVDLVQGYLYAGVMEAGTFEVFINTWGN